MDKNDANEKDEPKITNMKEKIEAMKKRMEITERDKENH